MVISSDVFEAYLNCPSDEDRPKSASDTTKAIIGRLKTLPAKARKTITMDNGTEMPPLGEKLWAVPLNAVLS